MGQIDQIVCKKKRVFLLLPAGWCWSFKSNIFFTREFLTLHGLCTPKKPPPEKTPGIFRCEKTLRFDLAKHWQIGWTYPLFLLSLKYPHLFSSKQGRAKLGWNTWWSSEWCILYINPSKLTWQAEHVIFGWKRKNILSTTHESFEFHVTFQGFSTYISGSMYTYTHTSYIISIFFLIPVWTYMGNYTVWMCNIYIYRYGVFWQTIQTIAIKFHQFFWFFSELCVGFGVSNSKKECRRNLVKWLISGL